MPLYLAQCKVCGEQQEIYRSFARYEELPECCGEKMARVICPSMVMADIQPYVSQIDGSVISSRSRHKEHLKAHQCIEVGNETASMKPHGIYKPEGLKETLIEVANAKLR